MTFIKRVIIATIIALAVLLVTNLEIGIITACILGTINGIYTVKKGDL